MKSALWNRFLMASSSPYQLKPLKLGAEVYGIQLSDALSQNVIKSIKEDVTQHRILVFREQYDLKPKHHIEISKWFGDLESTFYKHPRSPHPDIFRVSNNDDEGCTGVGRTGWHIDGSFQDAPFSYSLYHIISVPKQGDTVFAGLTEIIENLDHATRAKWDRLWMASNRRHGPIHPLIYSHPITLKPVLCFHLGMTEGYIWDYNTDEAKWATPQETMLIKQEINHQFVKNNGEMQYSHKWMAGDFIISDNLAVGHEASKQTQYSVNDVGLRVMHRTTIKGHKPPAKIYN